MSQGEHWKGTLFSAFWPVLSPQNYLFSLQEETSLTKKTVVIYKDENSCLDDNMMCTSSSFSRTTVMFSTQGSVPSPACVVHQVDWISFEFFSIRKQLVTLISQFPLLHWWSYLVRLLKVKEECPQLSNTVDDNLPLSDCMTLSGPMRAIPQKSIFQANSQLVSLCTVTIV